MELEREELSTKVDEANQTIGALRFENNFLSERTKKLEAKLFQVQAQLERTSNESWMKYRTSKNWLLTELAWSMNSLTLLILPPLVRLFLSSLLIMKILRKMKLKLR